MPQKIIPLWTLYGLRQGKATIRWPAGDRNQPGQQEDAACGQVGFLGMPRFDPAKCRDGCRECADACLPGAISLEPQESKERVKVDYGRCVACQMRIAACPARG